MSAPNIWIALGCLFDILLAFYVSATFSVLRRGREQPFATAAFRVALASAAASVAYWCAVQQGWVTP